MTRPDLPLICAAGALLALLAQPTLAAVAITEVAPWSSGHSPVGADWFELTNTGASAISLTGWSMDDSSATPGMAALLGVSSLAAGQSAVFMEGDGSRAASFISTWFGANAPAGLLLGHYTGAGVGLSTGGDAVAVFDAAHVLQAAVSFGASPSGPYATFDNAAGLSGAISQISMVGLNGAFVAAADALAIGSPGISPVPEPASLALMLGGLLGLAALVRQRKG